MGTMTRPEHKLVLEFNGAEMMRIWDAAKAEGLSMEAWAAAVVSIEASEQALNAKRLPAEHATPTNAASARPDAAEE